MCKLPLLALLAVLAAVQPLLTRSAAAADWPQWRGPDRSNFSRETGLLQEWPTNGPPLAWQASGLGLGISPVSVAAGRVYTVGNRDGAEFAFALDAASGAKIWAARLGATVAENALMRWLTQRSPTVDGERLYTLTANGELFCLRTVDGRKLWQKSYAKDFPTRRSWGYCDHPLVDGDNLICTPFSSNATVVAFNKRSGEVVWKAAVEGESVAGYGATVVSMAGGIRHYVVLFNKSLVGVAADDGRVLWQHERANLRYGGTYTPIVQESRIFSANGYGGGMALFNLTRQGDGLIARQQYHKPFNFDAFQDSTVLVGDHVYAFGARGMPVCIKLQTGEGVWEQPTSRGTNRAALIYAGGRLYQRHLNGVVTLAEVSPAGYIEKGSFTIPLHERSAGVTFPVVAGGRLWVRDNDRLFCYDVRAGVPAGEQPPPKSILLSLTEREREAEDSASAVPRRGRDRPPDAIYIPTPNDVVERMVELAGVKRQDVVYDLGSGDGRIVIAAAKKFGAHAVGYEIDPRLVKLSRQSVAENKLDSLVRIEHEDIFTLDLSGADVITVFLYPRLMERLLPQLQKLKPGTRIVSHQFEMPGVPPEKEITVESKEDGEPHRLFMWTAPLEKTKPSPDRADGLSRNDWPMFGGGPTRNAIGVGKNPPKHWGTKLVGDELQPAFNIKWLAQTGAGFSMAAPVVADGFVWVGTNNENPRDPDHKEPAPVLMCFRESDGAFVWQYRAPVRKGLRSDISFTGLKCSPLIEGDKLWFTTPGAEVICLDIGPLRRGKGMPVLLWKLDMTDELAVFVHPFVMGWPGANSVALHDRWIYVNTDNAVDLTHNTIPNALAPSLVCLEKETGKVVWEDNSPGTRILHIQWSSPLALNLEGEGRVIAGLGDGWLRSFAAATGKLLWELDCNPPEYRKRKYPAADGPSEILAPPVFHNGRIYVAIGQEPEHGEGVGNLVCVEAKTGSLIWQNRTIHRSISSVVVVDDYVYAADLSGFIHGLAADSGKVRWRYDAQAHIWCSPLVVDRLLYLGDVDGDVTVIDLDRVEARFRSGKEPLQLDKRSVSRRAADDDKLSGAEVSPAWIIHMNYPLYAAPAYANGVLYWNVGGYLCAVAPLTNALGSALASKNRKLPDAVFVPTPQDVVERMLKLAGVTKGDRVVDLGSGDGRVVITAARDYGSRAVGYEVDPVLARRSVQAVREYQLDGLVFIEERDLFAADLSQADVVVVYLPGSLLQRLLPHFKQLKPGARVVSHEFVIPGIAPDETVRMISTEDEAEHTIHLWKAPLKSRSP